MNKLQRKLAEQGWVLADGATGTTLFNMGLEAGESPEIWNEQHPDRIAALYCGAIDAGSDLFLTNSFGGNRSRLALHHAGNDAARLCRLAAEIAREQSDRRGGAAIVAGSIGPTGDILEPVGELSWSEAAEIFEEQATGLRDGGADLLWIETMSSREEFLAAAEACRRVEMDWCGTMSFDSSGRTMMGLSPSELAQSLSAHQPKPTAFGANCGVGASDLLRSTLEMAASDTGLPIIAKANAGIPKFVDGSILYDGNPELMADYAELARNAGATVIGGCCGTGPEHLAAMRSRLESAPVGQPPDLDMVERILGPLTATGASRPGRSRRRRR